MSNVYCIFIALIVQFANGAKLNDAVPKGINDIFDDMIDDNSDIVPVVHTLHKRNVDPLMRIRAFQKDYKLYLKPNNNVLFGKNTPVYLSYKDKNSKTGVKYVEYKHNLNFQLYHNLNEKIALLISNNIRGHATFYGMIDNLLIRPISHSANRTRHRRSIFNDPLSVNDNEIYTEDHEVIKMNTKKVNHVFKSKPRNFQKLLKANLNLLPLSDEKIPSKSRRKRSRRIYPEILVVTDYTTFSDHDKNIDEFIKYMVVFWNGVDLKYRMVQEPRIRLSVAGLVIPQEPGASPYMENKILKENYLSDERVLTAISEFFYVETKLPKNYDIVVAVTHNDIVEITDGGYLTSSAGIAWPGCACKNDSYSRRFLSAALIEDNTVFKGIQIAVHELGHLFGARHDGDSSTSQSIPSSKTCPYEDGYIMSYKIRSENAQRWSSCSLKSMEVYLKSDNARCLRNKPKIENSYPRFLPGVIAGVKEQCKALTKEYEPCFLNDVNICHQLFCKRRNSRICFSIGAALEGSVCNHNNGICILGDCVNPPKNFPS